MNKILLVLGALVVALAILTLGLWRTLQTRNQQVVVEQTLLDKSMALYDEAKSHPRPVLIVQKPCSLPHAGTGQGWDTAPWSASPSANADPDLVEALGYRIAELESERDDLYRQMRQDAAKPPIVAQLPASGLPTRLVWAGWSLTNGWPALGGQMRILGHFWAGGWVRPGPAWDIGPTVSYTW